MGGPAAAVLLKRPLSTEDIQKLGKWLGEVVKSFHRDGTNDAEPGWEFYLKWPDGVGPEIPPRACLMDIDVYELDPAHDSSGDCMLSPADLTRLEALGWMPRSELSIGVGCNQPRDHKVLGWLSAELASRFDGMVAMNGILPIPEIERWKEAGLSGTLLVALHEYGDEGKLTKSHLADAAFLRTWLQHPNFHMIK